MKTKTVAIATLFMLLTLMLLMMMSCSKSEDPYPVKQEQTDPAIKVYYNDFLVRAKSHGFTIDKTVVLQFGTCDCIENGIWKVSSSVSDINLDFYTYHTLGHALLGRSETTEASIMNKMHASVWRSKEQAYMNELFKK